MTASIIIMASVNASDVALMSSYLPRRISVLHLAAASPDYCTLSPISCTRYSHLLLQPPAPAPAHLNPTPDMRQRRHVRVCLSLVDTRYNAEMLWMPEMLQNRCTNQHNQSGKLLAHYPELSNFRYKWVRVISIQSTIHIYGFITNILKIKLLKELNNCDYIVL